MSAPFFRELELVFGWLLSASWQASALALLVLLLQRALHGRLNPRWRYALWLPVILRLVMPVEPRSALSLFQFVPRTPPVIVAPVTEPLFAPAAPAVFHPGVAFAEPAYRVSLYSLLAAAWMTGALSLLVLTWLVNRRLARQIAGSPDISDPALLKIFTDAKAELAIRRTIRLIENTQVQSPAIMGLFRPTLLLPALVRDQFSPAELRLVFLHELAHLKRGDVVAQWLIALLQILHWFNPVLWFTFRRIRIDREPATDALVLSRTGEQEKERYGLMLIKLLEHFNQRHSLPTLVGILEDKDQFKRRFSLIARFTRGAYEWSLLGLAMIAALTIVGLTAKSADQVPVSGETGAPPAPPHIESSPFFPLEITGEIPASDASASDAINHLTLSKLDVIDMSMQDFFPYLAKLMKENNPQGPEISFGLMGTWGDDLYKFTFHLQKKSNLREILDQLNSRYPLRYRLDGTYIPVWQVSHFETDFDKKAAETKIHLNFENATLSAALKAVQAAATEKGFVFDVADIPRQYHPDSPPLITLQKDEISVAGALRFIYEARHICLYFQKDELHVVPNSASYPIKDVALPNTH